MECIGGEAGGMWMCTGNVQRCESESVELSHL